MSGRRRASQRAELRRAVEAVEALGERLAALLEGQQAAEREKVPARLLSAAEVSQLWRINRRWIYDHATELGARRLGEGPRPRLGFDPDELRDRLGAPAPEREESDRRRLTALGRKPPSDSLSEPARARFPRQAEHVAGRRANAPGTAPKNGASTR